MYKIAATLFLLLVKINSVAFAYAMSTPNDELNFTYDGHLFFNATTSALQGEKYLLNQQLSNLKLNSELQINELSKIKGLFIYNTLPTPVTPRYYFDQLYGELNPNNSNLIVEGGKNWLTFGRYKNDLIYKPLSKALGQTNESMISMGYDSKYYANLSLFSPHSRIRPSTLPFYFNLDLGTRNRYSDLGISFLYSIVESQLFQYNKGFGGFLGTSINSHVPGIAVYSNIKYKQVTTYFSYVTAAQSFQKKELSYENKGALPSAVSIQSAYLLDIKNIPVKLIGYYDRSFQALPLKLPEQRIGIGLAGEINPHLTLQFQYAREYAYAQSSSSTGLNTIVTGSSTKLNTFALQAILNF